MLAERAERMLADYQRCKGRKEYLEQAIPELEKEIERWKTKLAEEASSLGSPNMDGMPHGTTVGNPTERIALMLIGGYEPIGMQQAEAELQDMREELREARLNVVFVEAWMKGLTEKERWLIDHLYFEGLTYNETARDYTVKWDSPISRDGIRRMRKITVQKIASMAR